MRYLLPVPRRIPDGIGQAANHGKRRRVLNKQMPVAPLRQKRKQGRYVGFCRAIPRPTPCERQSNLIVERALRSGRSPGQDLSVGLRRQQLQVHTVGNLTRRSCFCHSCLQDAAAADQVQEAGRRPLLDHEPGAAGSGLGIAGGKQLRPEYDLPQHQSKARERVAKLNRNGARQPGDLLPVIRAAMAARDFVFDVPRREGNARPGPFAPCAIRALLPGCLSSDTTPPAIAGRTSATSVPGGMLQRSASGRTAAQSPQAAVRQPENQPRHGRGWKKTVLRTNTQHRSF